MRALVDAGRIRDLMVELGRAACGPFVAQEGPLAFHHFDLVAQALATIERGHAHDVEDVPAMVARGLVTTAALRAGFDAIEPRLYRYPAVDPGTFRRGVESMTGGPW